MSTKRLLNLLVVLTIALGALPAPVALAAPPANSAEAPAARPLAQVATVNEGFEGAFPPIGWAIYETGAADDPGWQQTSTRAHSGTYSAYHNDDNTTDDAIAWLVPPQISVGSNYLLTFWQNQNYYTYYTYHGIWVSTGSGDPDDGGFVELVELGAGTEDTWEKQSIDLSAYTGQNVYIAFRYVGDWADEWYIDDVTVQGPKPDLSASEKAADYKAEVGEVLTYTVNIRNTGLVTANNASLVDPIPAGTTFARVVPPATYSDTLDAVLWSGTVPTDTTVAVTFAVTPTAEGTITNTATISDPATLAPVEVSINSVVYPAGSLYWYEGFEEDDGGFVGGCVGLDCPATPDWEWGQPDYAGGPDGAHSGLNVWGTNLTDDYTHAPYSDIVHVLTGTLNLTGVPVTYTTRLQWWHWNDIRYTDAQTVTISSAAGSDVLWFHSGTYNTDWEEVLVNVPARHLGNVATLRFELLAAATSYYYDAGWYMDDLAVHIPPSIPDLSTSSKSSSAAVIGAGERLTYTVSIVNSGVANADGTVLVDPLPDGTDFAEIVAPVDASYNAAEDQVEWTGTVPAVGKVDVTFVVTATGDGLDCQSPITNVAVISQSVTGPMTVTTISILWDKIPYREDFELGAGGFITSGTNSSWAYGTPTTGPCAAHSGDYLWATNLDGDYNNSEESYLTSPAIDPTRFGIVPGYPLYLSWWQWVSTESCCDEFSVEVSRDGGASWDEVYSVRGGAAVWEEQMVDIANYATANFKVRFFMDSDPSVPRPGVYIDDISIQYCMPPAIYLIPDTQIGQACPGSAVAYHFQVLNLTGDTVTVTLSQESGEEIVSFDPISLTVEYGYGNEGVFTATHEVPGYFFAGQSTMAVIRAMVDIYTFDTAVITTVAGNAWVPAEAGGSVTLWPAYANDDTSLYYFDGLNANGDATDRVQIYTPGNTWGNGANHGVGNFYGGVAGYKANTGEFFYAPGFVDGMTAVDDFFGYDPSTDVWMTDTLTSRPEALGLGAGGVTADGDTFVWAGGSPNSGFLGYTPVYTYDVATDTWRTGTTLTGVGFTAPGYVMVGDKLYVGGNYFGDSAFYVYDVSDDAWTQLADLPDKAGELSPLFIYDPVSDDIYLVGGGKSPTWPDYHTFRYDIASGTWEPFADLNTATLGNGGGYLGGYLYTFGGGADANAAQTPAPHEYALSQCPEITPTAQLTGRVTNGVTGDPIVGTMVEAAGTGYTLMGNTTPVVWTDADGYYTMTLYAQARYDVTASYGTFDPRTESVLLPTGGTTQNFVLGPAVADASLTSFSETLPWGEIHNVTMTLANDGYSALEFEFVEEDGGGPFAATQGAPAPKLHKWGEFANQGQVGSLSVDPDFVVPGISGEPEKQGSILQNNLLNDPGFENGPPPASGWTEWADNACEWIVDPTAVWGIPAYAGTYAYWASGYCGGNPSTDYVEQQVTLPGGVCQLSFYANYYRVDPDDAATDTFYVEVNGTQVWAKEIIQANNTYPDWILEGPIDLSAYAGQTVVLRIGANSAGSTTGNVLVDEVLLECRAGIPWLSEDPITGTLPSQSVISPVLTFDASAVLALGTYTGTLILNSNDPASPTIEMPVTLEVITNSNAGQITGTVTSDRPGGPIEGVTVLLEAATGFTDTLTTDAAGHYERLIRPGDLGLFTITVSAPNYLTDVQTRTVSAGTTVHDVQLEYSGPHIEMAPLELEQTMTWGNVVTDFVTITNTGNVTLNYDIDLAPLLFEDFEGTFPPAGWSVITNTGAGWMRNDEWGVPNRTLPFGSGYCAAADADAFGAGMDTELWSPPIVIPLGSAQLEYASNFQDFFGGGDAYLDISTDGGTTWTNLTWWTDDHGPTYEIVDLSAYAGQTVILRWHFVTPGYDWYWHIDDVLVEVSPLWLSVDPVTGTVAVGDSATVTVTKDSSQIPGPSTYTAGLLVSSDDPLEPQVTIPVTMHVNANPDQGYLSGTVLGNRTSAGENQPLKGARVEVTKNVTDTFATQTDVAGFYELYFLPTLTGTYTVTISYDGYVTDTDTVAIANGVVVTHDVTLILDAPFLNASPESIAETLAWGGSAIHTLIISNPLPANQALDVNMFEIAGSYTPPTVQTVQVHVPATPAADEAAREQVRGPRALEARPAWDIEVVIDKVALGQIELLILSPDSDVSALQAVLEAYPDLNVTVWDPAAGVPDVSDLLPYSVVVLGNDYLWSFCKKATGNALADYIDAGGKVIEGLYVQSYDKWGFGGRYMTEGYSPFTPATMDLWGYGELGIYNAGHPVMDGVSTMTDNWGHQDPGLAPGAEAVAYWNDGYLYIAANENVVAFNQLLHQNADWTGDVPTLLHNAVLYLAPVDVPWLSESVTDFSIAPTGSATSTITLDASVPEVTQPGTYRAWLWLDNNDPLQVGAYVPVEMTVQVEPDMGRLAGQVTLNRHESGMHVPAVGATVILSSTEGVHELATNAAGEYLYHYQAAALPLDVNVVASYPDYQDAETTVTLHSTEQLSANLELELLAPWLDYSPTALEVEIPADLTTTLVLDIKNLGLETLDIPLIQEIPFTVTLPLALADRAGVMMPAATGVDPFIYEQFAASPDGKADFFIAFKDTADLTPACYMDWSARGRFVMKRLQAAADAAQADVKAWLEARGIAYTSLWINNTLFVHADEATLNALAVFPDVSGFMGNRTYQVWPVEPAQKAEGGTLPSWFAATPAMVKASQKVLSQKGLDEVLTPAYPWNVSFPGADQVHTAFGMRGEGIVVAGIDTGVEYDHIGLVNNYRGNLGGGAFDHTYSWYDPLNECPPGEPCDTDGHGTATHGIMAGDDDPSLPDGAWIGMAPNVRWIHCMGLSYGSGDDYELNLCAQWMLAPGGEPDMRPHVVNNSWGSWAANLCDNWYAPSIQAWRAAGIFPAFAAGNMGDQVSPPHCCSSTPPANSTDAAGNPIAFASGAHGSNGMLDYYSSGGPNACNPDKLFPDLVSPGLGSCTTGLNDSYNCSFGGTSAASPHTAGCAALVRQANPFLTMAEVEQALRDAADDVDDTECGGTPDWNNKYGEGRLNCYEAVAAVSVAYDISWLSLDPISGTVEPLVLVSVTAYTGTMPVEVTFDSAGLDAGVYTGTLRVLHNDPLSGQVLIPVTMTVETYEPVLTPAVDARYDDPGATVVYTLTLTNNGSTTDTFDLAASGNVWTTTVPATVTLAAGESGMFNVEVEIPSTAHSGDSDTVTVTATSQGAPTKSASSVLTTMVNVYGVRVAPTTASADGVSAVPVFYTLQVDNTGNVPDTFDVDVGGGNTWTTTVPATVGPLAAGVSANLVVTVTIPATALDGATDMATITVASRVDPTQSATAVLTTTSRNIYGVMVAAPTDAMSGEPGTTVTYTLRVTNTGNTVETFTLSKSSTVWTTDVPAGAGPLASGEGADVQVVVHIPSDAAGGDFDSATVTATSQSDPTQSDSSVLTTEAVVTRWYIYLPLVLRNAQ